MYSQEEIEAAVAEGALAPEQAASLRSFVAARNRTPHSSEEYFRLIRGYNDIFVTIACILLLVALGWLGMMIPTGTRASMTATAIPPLLQSLFIAAGAWGLAELFTRQRRVALPSIVLALYFGSNVVSAVMAIAAPMMTRPESIALLTGAAFAIAGVATWGFWHRFAVPFAPAFALALGVFSVFLVLGVILLRSAQGETILNIVLLLIGIGLFVYAMSVDREDRWRVTAQSEVAFWLHCLASLVLVLPLAHFLGLFRNDWTLVSGILMVVLFVIFTAIALLVDRKVYIASCLLPLGLAVYAMFQAATRATARPVYSDGYGDAYGGGYAPAPRDPALAAQEMMGGMIAPMLVIAILTVLLAFFWAPLRRSVLGILPPSLRESLPTSDAAPLDEARAFQ